jgi:hypothetical protein
MTSITEFGIKQDGVWVMLHCTYDEKELICQAL